MAASITEGGYDFDFLTDLPEDLTCVLCHFAFKNPVQVEECGHVFCKQCFDNMKDYAAITYVELLCPLDRLKIDVTRVFKDKFNERRVLNLMVKCQNFGDKCDWTGELRQALEHELTCCKHDMLDNPFGSELKQLINRMTELQIKVKDHERKLVEKDTQIINLENHNANQNKQIKDQAKAIVDQRKQILNLEKHIENQHKQTADQNKQIKSLQQSQTNQPIYHQSSSTPLSMIIPNIEEESKYSPMFTAFQWKFKPSEVKSGILKNSPPFYNAINAYCFQLLVQFDNNNFRISLRRYRGKYDDNVNEIETTNDFDFQIHIFGKNGKLKLYKWDHVEDYSIPKHEMFSEYWWESIVDGEISSLTVDGYVHLHCFFNHVNQ